MGSVAPPERVFRWLNRGSSSSLLTSPGQGWAISRAWDTAPMPRPVPGPPAAEGQTSEGSERHLAAPAQKTGCSAPQCSPSHGSRNFHFLLHVVFPSFCTKHINRKGILVRKNKKHDLKMRILEEFPSSFTLLS